MPSPRTASSAPATRASAAPTACCKLTGRVKELFKTAKGEYVAPAPIENRLNAHPMVELSLVSGVGQPAAYADGGAGGGPARRVGDAAVRAQVQDGLARLLEEVNRELAAHERLQMIVVADEALVDREWLPHADHEDTAQPHRGRRHPCRGQLVCDRQPGALGLKEQ